jgi:hypothetical protein
MTLPTTSGDREFQKFREPTGRPGEAAVAVVGPDGGSIGGTGGTSMLDDAAFTPGGSSVTPMGALFDDSSPDPVDEGDIGAPRMTQLRALHVNLRDASGAEVSPGAGTQYAEDAPAAANPTGTALSLVRADTPAAVTDADGDNVAARGTNKGELYVKHLDAVSVTDNGGTLSIDDGGATISIDDGGGSVTVDGAVTANLGTLNGAATDAQLQTSVGNQADAEASGNGSVIALLKRLRTLLAGGLPSALVGGRLDVNAGAWMGSTAPSVGQKTMANSIPVALASDQSAQNVKTNTGDEVAILRTTVDPVDGSGSTVTIKFVRVNATADGDNTVISAVGGKKLRVLGYALVVTAAGTITIQDSAGSPAVLAQFPLAANGGVSYSGGLDAPAFETPSGNGLEINNPAGVDTLGHLTYIEI